MAELLEKLLLISFGLSILVIILPPAMIILNKNQLDENPEKVIDSIIIEIKSILEELPKYENYNFTKKISFNGSVYVFNPTNNVENTFILRFCPSGSKNVIYHEISVYYNIEIQIISLMIIEYQLIAVDKCYFIMFR